jgi:hypothetical protein
VAVHVFRARRSVSRELKEGVHEKKSTIVITDAEPAPSSNYQMRLSVLALMSFLILAGFSYVSWFLAGSVTGAEIFAVDVGPTWIDMSRSLTGGGEWWVAYNGDQISPVGVAQFVDVTNLLPSPETIKSYSMAINVDGCGWSYLRPIPLEAVTVWFISFPEGLKKANPMDFRQNGFDFHAKGPIPSHGTISGWWFFAAEKKCDAIPDKTKAQYRFSISTFSGMKFEHTTPSLTILGPNTPFPVDKNLGGQNVYLKKDGPPKDISMFARVLL